MALETLLNGMIKTDSIKFSPCQICNRNDEMHSIFFMGRMPPPSTFEQVEEPVGRRYYYPIHLVQCNRCLLVQLEHNFPMEEIFDMDEYTYTTGTTKFLVHHFEGLVNEILDRFKWDKQSTILDIGSNDGTLLSFFQKQGLKVLGVDPSPAANIANKTGITTKKEFFNFDTAQKILKENGQFDFITAANSFAHVPDVVNFSKGVKVLLKKEGIFVVEVQYVYDTIQKVQFDTLYPEHLRYYSVTSLSRLLNNTGFDIFSIKRIPTHGGSIRAYFCHKGYLTPDESVEEILAQEKEEEIKGSLDAFSSKANKIRSNLLKKIFDIREAGQRIYGLSAPVRGSLMTHYLGFNEQLLDCVLEVKGSLKIGQFMPGTRIPILEEAYLKTNPPDYLFIFSWHIAEEMISICKKLGYEGKFIIPLPEPRVL